MSKRQKILLIIIIIIGIGFITFLYLLHERKKIEIKNMYDQACIYTSREKHEEALNLYKKILNYNPDYPNIYLRIAYTFNALNNDEEAEKYYIRATQKQPKSSFLYNNFAIYYINRNEYNKALKILEQGLEIIGPEWLIVYKMAFVYFLLGNQDKCFTYLEKVFQFVDAKYIDKLISKEKSYKKLKQTNKYKKLLKKYLNDDRPKLPGIPIIDN